MLDEVVEKATIAARVGPKVPDHLIAGFAEILERINEKMGGGAGGREHGAGRIDRVASKISAPAVAPRG